MVRPILAIAGRPLSRTVAKERAWFCTVIGFALCCRFRLPRVVACISVFDILAFWQVEKVWLKDHALVRDNCIGCTHAGIILFIFMK